MVDEESDQSKWKHPNVTVKEVRLRNFCHGGVIDIWSVMAETELRAVGMKARVPTVRAMFTRKWLSLAFKMIYHLDRL